MEQCAGIGIGHVLVTLAARIHPRFDMTQAIGIMPVQHAFTFVEIIEIIQAANGGNDQQNRHDPGEPAFIGFGENLFEFHIRLINLCRVKLKI